MKTSSTLLKKGLLAATFMSAGFGLSLIPSAFGTPMTFLNFLSSGADSNNKMTPLDQIGLIAGVLQIARQTYVNPDKVDNTEEMTSAMLKGALQKLDPHSDYLTPEDMDKMKESRAGTFFGIGIEVKQEKNKTVTIVNPMEDAPAAKAGLLAGDSIVRIDGVPTRALTLEEFVKRSRGAAGTSVKIQVLRQGVEKPLDFDITRSAIKTVSIKTAPIGNDIAYIKISQFDQDDLPDKYVRAVTDVKAQMGGHPSAHIIDLRNNPGGLLDAVVDMTSDTIGTNKPITTTRGQSASDNLIYQSAPGRRITDLTEGKPIVVLINGGSASASEIMAGALQDLAPDRVIVMGEQTFGKGSVQTIRPLSVYKNSLKEVFGVVNLPKGGIKLTTSLYYLPSGRSINGVGVTPDIRFVPIDASKELQGLRVREADLPEAIPYPKDATPDTTKTTSTCTPKEGAVVSESFNKILKNDKGIPDPQVLCAVEKLRNTAQWTIMAPNKALTPGS